MKPILLGALLLAAACSSSTSPGGGTTGSLSITITAPGGVAPRVTVLGPNGYRSTITSSQTISGLDTGTYTIHAQPGTTADPIVGTGYAGAVTGSPAAITPGATASATVTYTSAWAGAGVLWVASQLGNVISGFSSAQLSVTGAPTPAIAVGNGSLSSTVKVPIDVAVDATGGVWMTNGGDTLRYFSASQVTSNGNPTAVRSIVSAAIGQPTAIAIDVAGDLWVADQGSSKLFEFTAAQAAAGGTLTPVVTISPSLGSIDRPFDLAFDKFGDLWVVNYHGNSVAGFTPAQLAVTGAPTPFAAITGAQGVTGPLGAAFDANGNLWVASVFDSLVEYRASDLTAIGAPVPAVIITGGALGIPIQLAFDNSGALWVAANEGGSIVRYTSSQLAATGSPAPAVKISSSVSSSLNLPWGMAFSAAPPAYPVQ
jgi:sugar lactone lactonase YvrE